MPIFRYEATEPDGRVLRGAMEAATEYEVHQRLAPKGYRQIVLQPAAPLPAIPPPPPLTGLQPSARAEDLGLFCRQMAALLHAGFTPNGALANLAPRTANPALRTATTQMAAHTSAGASLAAELARCNGLFPEHIVGLIAAGETGGFLPFAFEEAALAAEQDAALRQGLWWVRFLLWQSLWGILFFQPLFPSIDTRHFEDFGRHGSTYLRWLAFLCVPLGIGAHALAHFGGKWWATPAGAPFRDRLTLRIPVMERLARMRALATFTRVLSKLLAAGITPTTAYAAAVEAVPNRLLRERLSLGLPVLRSAGGLDQAIQATGLMDHDPVQLLVTGQHAGQLTEMLDQVTALYQEEAARATDAARRAQKQLAWWITILSSAYVTILLFYYLGKLGFAIADGIEKG